jgi:Na+-driven multidrug efflux pump
MGFRVPRIYEEGGGGGVATITGAVVCLGVVTAVFLRRKHFKGLFDAVDRRSFMLSCRRGWRDMFETGIELGIFGNVNPP